MKKGFTLIEVLLILGTLPIFMIIMSRLFTTLMRETPRIWNNVQQNSTMLNMLSKLHDDIDKAKSMPESYGDINANENLFLIQQEDMIISYEFNDGKITRRVLNHTPTGSNLERIWEMPDANIKWLVHRKNGNGYCLEITNYIEYKVYGRTEKKMENSHLYFVGAL